MSLNDEERRIIVGLEYEKALQTYNKINILVAGEAWDFIANRLYYALFHAVTALLVNDGHTAESHKGKVLVFGQFYVKTGLFTKDEAKLYSRLQTMRENADYNCAFQTSEEEIVPFIKPVGELIEKIHTMLTFLE